MKNRWRCKNAYDGSKRDKFDSSKRVQCLYCLCDLYLYLKVVWYFYFLKKYSSKMKICLADIVSYIGVGVRTIKEGERVF